MAFHDLKHFGILLLFWLLHRTDAKSANNTTLGSGFADLTINVGNGLVDIAALTTLIGSSTAESLVLGDRGYAGLPWAAASAFGMISVIKGCIAGASPGWLRDTFGVRNGASDGALGMSLLLDKGTRRDERVRQELPTAVGITCKITSRLVDEKVVIHRGTTNDVYAFDRSTQNLISSVPNNRPTEPLTVFTIVDNNFLNDAFLDNPNLGRETWIAIFSSLPKIIEIYILWREGAEMLSWIGAFAWLYFMIAAITLRAEQSFSSRAASRDSRVDIVAGHLPSTRGAGGERKVILGLSDNRRLLTLRAVWAIGSVLCTFWLMASYFLLAQYESRITFVWAGFQILWLLLRLLFYHFTGIKQPLSHSVLPTATPWEDTSASMRERVFELTMALAHYQTFIHPRGLYSYKQDFIDSSSIRTLFSQVGYQLHSTFPLAVGSVTESTVGISVLAVIGDHILASAAWIYGSPLNGMDLYDSCIVFLKTETSYIAIPAARVLSQNTATTSVKYDVERSFTPRFLPRSSPNTGHDLVWWYWVPCGGNKWLQFHSEDLAISGERSAEIMTDVQITNKLQIGDLNISLTKAEDLEDICNLSMQTSRTLLNLLN